MKREAASAAHVQPFQMLHSQFARHYPPNPCYTAIPLATPFALSPPAGWSIGAASAHRAIGPAALAAGLEFGHSLLNSAAWIV